VTADNSGEQERLFDPAMTGDINREGDLDQNGDEGQGQDQAVGTVADT